MKNIGQTLKDAREKKGLSVQDVAIATKINNKTIQALEEGDVASLPAKPFLRGFVQTYARYLDLNVDEIMKRFLEVHGSTKPKTTIEQMGASEQESHEEVQKKVDLFKKIAYGISAVIAVVLIFVIQKVVNKYEKESKTAREQKEIVKSQLAVATTESQSAAAAATTTASAATTTAPSATATASVTPLSPPPPPAPAPSATTPPPPLKPIPPPPAPVAEVKKPEAPKKIEEVKKTEEVKKVSKPQELIIEALDNIEIRYTKDGEAEKTVRLSPEQILTIKADSKVSVSINDGGAVNIIHNGKDKGVPGSLGQSSKLNYP